MKTAWKTIVVSSMVLFLAACSNQWREGSAGISDTELMERLDEVTASSGVGSYSDLIEDPRTMIYFAEGPGRMGPAHSVLSVVDLSWLGLDEETTVWDLDSVTVFFLDGFVGGDEEGGGERTFVLIIDALLKDSETPVSISLETQDYKFTKDGFLARFGDGIEVFSYDVSKSRRDELASVIQLRIATDNGDGNYVDIGKISALVGFQ